MGALGKKLRSTRFGATGKGVAFYCPGCESVHVICVQTDGTAVPVWTFDGNADAPTFAPSILVTYSGADAGQTQGEPDPDWPPAASAIGVPDGERRHGSTGQAWEARAGQWVRVVDTAPPARCHSFVRGGNIEFLADSTHALAGKTVPLPDWPYAPGEYGGVDDNG